MPSCLFRGMYVWGCGKKMRKELKRAPLIWYMDPELTDESSSGYQSSTPSLSLSFITPTITSIYIKRNTASMPRSSPDRGTKPNEPQQEYTSTVLYDEERRAASVDELAPPDLDAILNKKRKWYHRLNNLELPRRYQMGLTGLSIVLSAVQANGVYCWPT
jgi:hypothetical protein